MLFSINYTKPECAIKPFYNYVCSLFARLEEAVPYHGRAPNFKTIALRVCSLLDKEPAVVNEPEKT